MSGPMKKMTALGNNHRGKKDNYKKKFFLLQTHIPPKVDHALIAPNTLNTCINDTKASKSTIVKALFHSFISSYNIIQKQSTRLQRAKH